MIAVSVAVVVPVYAVFGKFMGRLWAAARK
jgi:hypothetical protein